MNFYCFIVIQNTYSERDLQIYLEDGDELPGLPGWKAIETLGHAQSHLSFFQERDGVRLVAISVSKGITKPYNGTTFDYW